MSYLNRWDPVRDMVSMRDSMDRLFESFFETQQGTRQLSGWSMPLDVAENEDGFVVTASIPGIKPEDLEITYNNHTLTIKGEIKNDQNIEEARYHLRERRYGRFERSLQLPTRVNADQIEATYEAGVLSLRLPKTEEVKPRRIAIKGGEDQKMFEGSFNKSKN
jgi:HSP20 family protein